MKIVASNEEEFQSEAKITSLSRSVRIHLALKYFSLFFVLALFSVLLPAAHFILVPLFLLLGIYNGVSKYQAIYFVSLEGTTCPLCKNSFNQKKLYFGKIPHRLYCYSCRSQLRIFDRTDTTRRN